ncbi:hypothetical protein JOD54_004501 [Actinokineospora baliensis]|uniref:hypothetical protein n=1 Tax=Actinokineospora baliensis TaxID=547056 RepID=UPI00195D0443|nr:hypothetical protein [Actinokineospora baliensis]MBM7774297.1 hypothetical protein [Actinokineospora baliensis]
MWLRECPFDDQGLVRPVLPLALMCDTCGSVWCTPADAAHEDRVTVPEAPDWTACGRSFAPGSTSWATREDVDKAGWGEHPWHEEAS